MRPLPEPAVFSRADAKALGWTDSAISRALRAGRLVAVRRGQLAAATTSDPIAPSGRNRSLILAAQAAVRALDGTVVSHQAAALMHELPLLRPAPSCPSITAAPGWRSGATGVRIHRATLASDDIVLIDGWPVTSVARTLVDLGRWEPTRSAVVTIDAALHRNRVTPQALTAVLVRCWTWPRISRAARAIALADARSESPLESVSRLVLRYLGLPAPTLQPEIMAANGAFVGRVDFYWDEYGVVGEADGAGKYALAPTSLLAEKRRQELLEDLGVVVTRWGWDETRHPDALRRRVTKAIGRAQARSRSGLPREWSIR